MAISGGSMSVVAPEAGLGPFVVLAQTATGKACEALVKMVLDHSTTFVFGELLECPNVKAMQDNAEHRPYLELLRLFAYGTYPDYVARRSELPELSQAQRRKLQLLTIVSLATKTKVIKFAELQAALDVSTEREVENLIIEAVYQNLIVGKMDQEHRCLVVETCACRDCRDEDIDFIIDTLTNWQSSADRMLQAMNGMVQYSHNSFESQRAAREELENHIQATRASLKEGDGGKAGGSGTTRMQTDDAEDDPRRAKGARGRWMGMGSSSRGRP